MSEERPVDRGPAGSHWCALCEWSDHGTDHCSRAVGVRIVTGTGIDEDAELLHKRSGEILPDGRILVTDPEDIARLRRLRADIDADLERRSLARAGEHRVPRRGWCERLTGWLR